MSNLSDNNASLQTILEIINQFNLEHTHTTDDITDIENLKAELLSTLMQDYGNLPEGYTRCSYIESSGTQYIQTNIVPNQDTRVIIDFEVEECAEPKSIFGARINVEDSAFGLWVENKEGFEDYVHVCPQYGSVNYYNYHILMNPVQRLFIDMYSTGAIVNDQTSTWERSEFSTGSKLTIFSMCSSNVVDSRRAVGRLRTCRVYENSVLSLFLVPCINPNGDAGMFDKVSNEFYGNAGEGVFVAG